MVRDFWDTQYIDTCNCFSSTLFCKNLVTMYSIISSFVGAHVAEKLYDGDMKIPMVV